MLSHNIDSYENHIKQFVTQNPEVVTTLTLYILCSSIDILISHGDTIFLESY